MTDFVPLLLLAFFSSCSGGTNYVASEEISGEEESTSFKTSIVKKVQNGGEIGDVAIRLYEDNEYIAYIGVRTVLKNLYNFKMTGASCENGIYTYRVKMHSSRPSAQKTKNVCFTLCKIYNAFAMIL